ncbi:MAG: hypothetical protein DRR16_13080 [Candidatus Parabeggiatoa sp. nov. 3]|nr:MAG: hypothetical protein DRR00_20255 [Gammaproteobacteria bacterium]RKZ63591.1 MAG: hypothetical protein DRQ99_16830 [Gammaproteobacteria bacterium]RKZ85027.1 MAG: hypothetical protein DRR16_13080 [Gammaproteobacteria bacterium]
MGKINLERKGKINFALHTFAECLIVVAKFILRPSWNACYFAALLECLLFCLFCFYLFSIY